MTQLSIYDRVARLEAQVQRLTVILEAQAELLKLAGFTPASAPLLKAAVQPRPVSILRLVEDRALSLDKLRMADICTEVARANLVTVDDLRGPSRKRPFAWPRQDAMVRMHEEGFSLPQIGRFLNRDHTTILDGIRAARSRERACAAEGVAA